MLGDFARALVGQVVITCVNSVALIMPSDRTVLLAQILLLVSFILVHQSYRARGLRSCLLIQQHIARDSTQTQPDETHLPLLQNASTMTSAAPIAYSTVLYPNAADLAFDMDYYISKHMPLCAQNWGPYGLQSWQVVKFDTHPDGSTPPYAVQAILHWSRPEELKVVTDEVSKPIFDDVKVFNGKAPIFLVGQWTGSGKAGGE